MTHEGLELLKGVDYDVVYPAGRKAVGKYTVSVKLKGRFAGSGSARFTIKPATASVKSLTAGKRTLKVAASCRPSAKGAAAYKIAYRLKGSKTWKYVSTTAQSKVIKSLKKGRQYYVKVRAYKKVGGVTHYGSWSKTKLSKKVK
ncbi:MAG: fibronectin type III domain-containing protein [Coriobacteriia bacterium]|nr:fibronectin type III domain-containing protein [Coriobacteriia bacterium]